jgi:prepilin-type N-terminal cleavage/methylation domain-containing protein
MGAKRGVTILELMVVTAITAVLMLAMAQVMVITSRQRHLQRQAIDRSSNLFMGETLMERTVENAGYHVPSGRFSFRLLNNLANGQTFGGIPVRDCQAPDAGEICIVPGTDGFEVSEGHPGNMGEVRVAVTDGGSINVILGTVGPLPIGDLSNRTFVFGNKAGQTCVATGSLVSATDNSVLNVQMLDRFRTPVATNFYSTGSAPPTNYDCPAAGMWVGVEERRTRYVVASTRQGNVSLYSQDAFSSDGGMQELAPSIDNMQIVPLAQWDGGTGCSQGLCQCNVTGNTCQLTDTTADYELAEQVVGIEVRMSARGQGGGAEELAAPLRLADEPPSPADRVPRRSTNQTIFFRNLAFGGK